MNNLGDFKMPCDEIWNDLIKCGGYNSEVDSDIVSVMELIKNKMFVTDIAERLKMSKSHVEIIQYILCSMDYAEYGTSPRGCWLTKKGEDALKLFKKRFELMDEEERG